MSIRRCLLPLLAAIALHASAAGAADAGADPWSTPPFALEPKALLAATAGPPSDEAATAEVYLHELTYRLDATGRRTETRRTIYKILTPDGVEDWSQIEKNYLPWYQETPRFTARVVTPDAKSRSLDPKTIADSPAVQDPELLDDERVLRAPLPAVTVGAVVELEVVVVDRRPYFEAGTVTRASLELGVPVRLARVTLEAPRNLPLRHRFEGLPGVTPRLEGQGSLQRVSIEARDLPGDYPWWVENLPPEAPRGPAVVFSTGESWASIATAYSEVVDWQIANPGFAGFDELKSPANSQLEEIRLLLDRVHREVRYTGVELGDAGLVPRPPGETAERRFGDCKDKAALVVALLRDRGIPAYVALLNAGRGQDVSPQLPGIGLFNHAIVYVPGSPALWIDATDPVSRLGQLPAADQGRLALVASPTTADLITTPIASSEDNRSIELREVQVALRGKGELVETSEYHGEPARELRAAWLDVDAEDITEALENYAKNSFQASKLLANEQTDARDLTQPMRTKIRLAEVEVVSSEPHQAVVAIPLAGLFQDLPRYLLSKGIDEDDAAEEATPRSVDYYLPYRFRRQWTYRIVAPSNYELRELPKDETVPMGPAVFTKTFAREPQAIVAKFELTVDRVRLTPAEVEAFRSAFAPLKNVGVWFDQTVDRALQAGHVKEALAEAQRLATEYPDKAEPWIDRSKALLAAGFGEEAQKAARQATEIEPTSGEAFHNLGWVFQHDALGRRLESGGYDRAAAIAALEKALELEPDNPVFVAELAIQLEYDAEGGRYTTSPEDLGRAIELYRRLQDELENETFANNLLIVLARAGRWQELAEANEKRPKNGTTAAWQVATKTVLEGADAGIAEAGRQLVDPGQRSQTLVQVSQELIRLRRYDDASKLLAASSRLNQDTKGLLSRSQLFGRAKALAWDHLQAPTEPSESLWLIFGLLFSPSLDVEALQPYLTPAFRERPISAESREFFEGMRASLRKRAAKEGLTLEILADILRATMQPSVEPDPSGDFRVSAPMGNREPLTVLAIRADDSFLVLPAELSTLGFEARWRAEHGELEAARRYLDWALEEAPPTHPKDPLSGSPFAMIWQKGRAAEVDDLRLAGAVAAVLSEQVVEDDDVQVLEELRPLARTPSEALAVSWALATAHLQRKEAAPAEADAVRLLAAYPDSESALALVFSVYGRAGRTEDLVRLGQARLERKPEDPWGLRFLVGAASLQGHYAEAVALTDRLLATGKAMPIDYNQSAWLRVFAGQPDTTAQEHAERAVSLTSSADGGVLHTLATVYAEADQPNEAYATLKQAVAARDEGRPASPDWYVLGRMAETYELPAVARELYQRVEPPEQGVDPLSTWHLAQRRLAQLP